MFLGLKSTRSRGSVFEHKAQEFLAWSSFQDNWSSVEALIEADLLRSKISKLDVSKKDPAVNIATVTNEKIMVGEKFFEVDGPNSLTD